MEEIERRYRRLKEGKRRPSFEYVSTLDIKEVFGAFLQDKEILEKLSDDELHELYDKWYAENKDKETTNEVKPKIEPINEVEPEVDL